MPRYHFNIHDGRPYRDEEGTELPDLAAARSAAAKLAGLSLHDEPGTFWNGEEWRLEVTDDKGLILFSLMFVALDAPCLARHG